MTTHHTTITDTEISDEIVHGRYDGIRHSKASARRAIQARRDRAAKARAGYKTDGQKAGPDCTGHAFGRCDCGAATTSSDPDRWGTVYIRCSATRRTVETVQA